MTLRERVLQRLAVTSGLVTATSLCKVLSPPYDNSKHTLTCGRISGQQWACGLGCPVNEPELHGEVKLSSLSSLLKRMVDEGVLMRVENFSPRGAYGYALKGTL
jgi:hypothetical protein